MINKLLKMIFKQRFVNMDHKNKWVHYHMKQLTKEVTHATRYTERK